jgi:hypothetical protein
MDDGLRFRTEHFSWQKCAWIREQTRQCSFNRNFWDIRREPQFPLNEIYLGLVNVSGGQAAQHSAWLRTGWNGFDPQQGQRIFLLASKSRPILGSIQPPIQWVPGVISPGIKPGRGVTLTTHHHLATRSRTRSYTSLYSSPSIRVHGVWWDGFTYFY